MAFRTTSIWRRQARVEIARILATLPPDADLKAKRRALRDGYPWDRVGWAYKAWCIEQKAALAPVAPGVGGDRPKFIVMTNYGPRRDLTLFLVEVYCPMCGRGDGRRAKPLTRGCLVCGPLVDRLDDLLGCDEFRGLLKAIRVNLADGLPRLVAADWLDERGEDELAGLFRAVKVKTDKIVEPSEVNKV